MNNIIKFLKIKKMIKQIDNSIKVKYGKILECEPENAVVYIGFKNTELENRTFRDYVNELQPDCIFNDLLLGILHEIGHIYTLDEADETEYLKDTELLNQLYRNDLISDEQRQYFYLRLPLESKATKWGLDFTRENENCCKQGNKIIF